MHDDGWTLSTLDGKNSAHYELMVAINGKTPLVLSTFEYIKE